MAKEFKKKYFLTEKNQIVGKNPNTPRIIPISNSLRQDHQN
jgi:hypothetical protein